MPTTRRAGLLIFALSITVRVCLIFLLHQNRELDRTEMINTAVSVMEGRGFGNAYGASSGPSAHFAPLYPLLLSGVFRATGTGSAGALAQEIVGYSVTSLTYALLPALAEALGMPVVAGVLAGFFSALVPVNFWSERGTYTSVWAALSLSSILIYSAWMWRERRFDFKRALMGGLLAGMAMLSDPILFMVMVSFGLAAAVALRFRPVLYWCVLVFVPMVMLTPWMVRNLVVLGSPIWTRSNLGLELSVSNTDGSRATVEENAEPGGVFSRRHPYSNSGELQKVERVGEVAYNKARMAESEEWILSHRGAFTRLCLQRFVRFWFPFMLRPLQTGLNWVMTLAGLAGFVVWFRSRSSTPVRVLPLVVFVVFPLPYYVIQTSGRYRFPLENILALFACWLAWTWYESRGLYWARATSRRR